MLYSHYIMSYQPPDMGSPELHEQGSQATHEQDPGQRPQTRGNESDPDLDLLIRIASSRQLPGLLDGADATHTVAGNQGPRWRFEGQGTPEGDNVLESSLRAALKALDAKREREAT